MTWIDASQIPAGDRMAPIANRINSSYAEFCELLSEADGSQEWLADGSPNVVQWLNARFGIEESFGRRLWRVARRLRDLPELEKRFATGELSLDAVDLLSEVATPDNELDLIEHAAGRDLAVHRAHRLSGQTGHPRGVGSGPVFGVDVDPVGSSSPQDEVRR